jgi:hypothetical protein
MNCLKITLNLWVEKRAVASLTIICLLLRGTLRLLSSPRMRHSLSDTAIQRLMVVER